MNTLCQQLLVLCLSLILDFLAIILLKITLSSSNALLFHIHVLLLFVLSQGLI